MARSSTYGNILSQMPNWVFGGEFGDISNLLNNREQEYQQTRQAETTNEIRDIALEEQRRQQRMDEEMRNSGIFADGKQPTIGEMYDMKRKIAMQYGGVDDVLSIDKELAQIRDAQEKESRQRIKEQREDEEYAWRKARRGKSESGGRSDDEIKGVVKLVAPDGSPELVKKSEYNAKIKAGYRDPDIENALLLNPVLTPKPPSSFDEFVAGMTGRSLKPGEQETKRQQDLTANLKQNTPGAKSSTKPTSAEILAELERREKAK